MSKSSPARGKKRKAKDSADSEFAAMKQATLFETEYGFKVAKRAKRTEADSNSGCSPDPSRWRETTLPDDMKISKGDARSQYRLSLQEFENLEFTSHFTKEGHTSHLYLEREVERKVWEKHGGPEGWKSYLEKLRKQYAKRHGPTSVFPEPQLPADKKKRIDEVYIKQEAKLRANFPPWLWNQLQDFYRPSEIFRKLDFFTQLRVPGCDSRFERLDMIRAADEHKLIEAFPLRPSEEIPIPESAPFNALRELLAAAPVAENEIDDKGKKSVRLVKTRWGERVLYDWTDEFKESVITAVKNIEREYDEAHKRRAVWMVYDTYTKCLWPFGIRFVGNTVRTTEGEELGRWEIRAIKVFDLLRVQGPA